MHHSIWTNLNSFVSSIFALFGWAEAAGWADSRWADQPSRSAPASRSTPLGAALLNGPSSWLPPPGGLTSSYPHFSARTVPASHQPSVPNRDSRENWMTECIRNPSILCNSDFFSIAHPPKDPTIQEAFSMHQTSPRKRTRPCERGRDRG